MNGSWQVVLTEAADRDIDDIVAGTIRSFGPIQARAYEDLLASAVMALRNGPAIIGSKSWDDIAAGLRTYPIARRGQRASHRLVYRAISPTLIEIVRILHNRMDLRRHLPPGII